MGAASSAAASKNPQPKKEAAAAPASAPPSEAVPAPAPAAPKQIGPLLSVTTSSSCKTAAKGLFVRADPLDNFHYALDRAVFSADNDPTAKVADAKGLSVSFTDDKVAASRTAIINGRISYLLMGERCGEATPEPYVSGFGIAPFIASNGTWSDPLPKKQSNNVLKSGMDFQLSHETPDFPLFWTHYFYISPYYQTDYQSRARLDGVALAWEPVAPTIWLGLGPVSEYASFYWMLRPEVDIIDVSQPGLTNLSVGRHIWAGETVRANLSLFPLTPLRDWPPLIGGRFSLIGTAENYYDTQTRARANYYSATLQYKLGSCVKDAKSKDPSAPCTLQGASSISFEYDWGTDKDTLVFAKKYLIKLGFAY
jgi:hypothetical protein